MKKVAKKTVLRMLLRTLLLCVLVLLPGIDSLQAAPQVACAVNATEVARAKVFTQELTIALSNGDVPEMNKLVEQNYNNWLGNCTDQTLKSLCDFECMSNVGEYFLFMSSEIAYYYTKVSDKQLKATSPAVLESYVDKGLEILEKGKKALLSTGGSDQSRLSYVAQASKFDLLRVQLFMASGDNWYQSMSEQRLLKLSKLVDTATGTVSNTPASSQNIAAAKYEEALWILTETLMGLPDSGFELLEQELRTIEDAINRRLNSLEKGYIYLDIDPEAGTFRSVDKVKDDLGRVITEIAAIESKVNDMMSAWVTRKGDAQVDKLNDQARKGDLSMSLSGYKIAQIETEASQLRNEVESRRNDTDAAIRKYQNATNKVQAEFELVSKKIENQFELQKRVNELKNRITLLDGKKEIDILDFKQASILRDIENLKWLMNWDIAKTNIELQIRSFDAQQVQFERELARNNLQRGQLEKQIDQIKLSNQDIGKQKDGIQEERDKLISQRDEVDKKLHDASTAAICSMEYRIARLGGSIAIPYEACNTNFEAHTPTSALTARQNICAQQDALEQLQIDDKKAVLKCVVGLEGMPLNLKADLTGVSCPAGIQQTYAQLTALLAQEDLVFQAEFETVKTKIKQQQAVLKDVQSAFKSLGIQKYTANLLHAVQAGIALGSAWVPDTEMCACGLASGATVKLSTAGSLFKTAELIESLQNRAISYQEFLVANQEKIQEIGNEINILASDEHAKKLEETYKALHKQKQVNDLLGEAYVQNNSLKEFMAQQKLSRLNCGQEQQQITTEIELYKQEHQRLVTELAARQQTTKNIQFDLNRLDIEDARLKLQVTSNISKIAELGLQQASLDEDDTRLRQLLGLNETNKTTVNSMKSRLDTQENQLANKEKALTELITNKEAAVLALGDTERRQLEEAIRTENFQATALNERIDENMNLINQRIAGLESLEAVDNDLKAELVAVTKNMNDRVTTERNVIFNTLQTQIDDANQDQKQKIFVMTQDEIARMVQGVPSFIRAKRGLVEEANRLLVLLRNKASTLLSLTGSHPLSADDPKGLLFLKNADQIKSAATLTTAAFWASAENQFKHQINYRKVQIPLTGALLETLRSRGRARFEVSPFLGDTRRRITGNSFSIGSSLFIDDPNLIIGNHVLIDSFFNINYARNTDRCVAPNTVILRHEGSGYVFRQVSDQDKRLVPSMVVRDFQWTVANAFSDQNMSSKAGLDARSNGWDGINTDLVGFDKLTQEKESRNVMPLLGFPVISSYDLIIPRTAFEAEDGNRQDCDISNIDMYLVYAYKPGIN